MTLDEFLKLTNYLSQLRDRFPQDVVWGELELSVRNYWRQASQERANLVPPPQPEKWDDWCKDGVLNVLTGENIKGTIFYPRPIVFGVSSTVDGAVYSAAEINAAPHTAISGDVVSRKSIVWGGQLARSLVAPEIHLDKSRHNLNITGSIICQKLRITPKIPLSGRIAGDLLVREAILDSEGNKFLGPLRIASDSKLGGIHVPCSIECGDHVTANCVHAEDIALGEESRASVIKGRRIVIGARCQIGQIHAKESLEVGEASCIHTAIAQTDIKLGPSVEITGSIIASLHGNITVDTSLHHFHYKGNLGALLPDETVDHTTNNLSGSIILRFLSHEEYRKLQQMQPGWLDGLEPVI